MTSTDGPIADPRKEDAQWWPPEHWPERIERAREAHRAGRRLRAHKRLPSLTDSNGE